MNNVNLHSNMGIETKYEYIYYTIINTNQLGPLTREEWFDDGFTWHEAINYVEHLLKNSEDKSVNNYRVDYAQWCDDISHWIRSQERHKVIPIFVQFHDNQPVKLMGEGDLFVLYEEDNADDEGEIIISDIDDGLASD